MVLPFEIILFCSKYTFKRAIFAFECDRQYAE